VKVIVAFAESKKAALAGPSGNSDASAAGVRNLVRFAADLVQRRLQLLEYLP
jgi:hypothetical protein